MKKFYTTFLIIVLLGIGIIFGDMIRMVYFNSPEEEKIIITDTLSLENQGSVEIRLEDGEKIIIVSYEDLQYVTKKKGRTKETMKKLETLFERLKDHK